jgi:hypothetical protein
LRGDLTVRQLRVMVQHLPPGSAAHLRVNGPWGDVEGLLWDVSSRLRDLVALTANVNRGKDSPPVHLPHLPTPPLTDHQRDAAAQADAQVEAERQDLLRVLARPGGTRQQEV